MWYVFGVLCMLNAPQDCKEYKTNSNYSSMRECFYNLFAENDSLPAKVMGSDWVRVGCEYGER